MLLIASNFLGRLAQSGAGDDATETFLEENGLLIGVVITVVAVIVGSLLAWGAHKQHQRQAGMAPAARRHDLSFSRDDGESLTRVAFRLFSVGDGRTVENVMGREAANGLPLRAFDYSYYTEHVDPETGQVTRRYKRFTCALAQHNGLWPTIRVARERTFHRVGQRLGVSDIELESEEFNRLFIVDCADPRFATDLLSPSMMEYLLTTEGLMDFETKGRWLLVTAPRVDHGDELAAMVNLAGTFIDHIPPVVWDLYDAAPDPDSLVASEGIPLDISELRDAESPSPPQARTEYDLDGNPITDRPDEQPWE